MSLKIKVLIAFGLYVMLVGTSCKRGCMKDVPCVDNYDPKAEKEGDCLGCTVFGAYNYCPEADRG